MTCNIPILLSSTILPHLSLGIYEVKQTEHERYKEYCDALIYIARTKLFNKIVFADNSSSKFVDDLWALAKSMENKDLTIEIINIPIENEGEVQGKGYGEGLLITQAIQESEFLKSSESFIKLTGRYKLRNLYRLVPIIQNALDKYENLDFVCQGLHRYNQDIPIVSTAFFWCKTSIWKQFFMDAYQKVNDKQGWAFEAEVAERLKGLLANNHLIGEIPLPLIVDAKNTKNNQAMQSDKELYSSIVKSFGAHLFKKQKLIKLLKKDNF